MEITDPQKLLQYARNNVATFLGLADLETIETPISESGKIVPERFRFSSNGKLDPKWHTENHYPRKIKYLKAAADFLHDNIISLSKYLDENPDCNIILSNEFPREMLEQINKAVKQDNRLARQPRIYDALMHTAIACGYSDLAEAFQVEKIWSQVLQLLHEKEHPISGNNIPVRARPEQLVSELDAVDLNLLDANRRDLVEDSRFQLTKLLTDSPLTTSPASQITTQARTH